MGVSWEQRV
ncbi:rCG42971, partial [Rattus norvegicus]